MSNIDIKIHVGLGDAIFTSAALKQSNYENIKIFVEKKYFRYRSDSEHTFNQYQDFFFEFLHTLLDDDNRFSISRDDSACKAVNIFNFGSVGIKACIPDFRNELVNHNLIPKLLNNDYIVITTKVREYPRHIYNSIKNDLFQYIKSLNKQIVVIGEREVELNSEYKKLGNDVSCIYDDLKINIGDFIDLTVPKLGLTIPSIENIKRDCSIMNKASSVITFGIGGNFSLALASSEKIISFRNLFLTEFKGDRLITIINNINDIK